jgi:hypothetical protein
MGRVRFIQGVIMEQIKKIFKKITGIERLETIKAQAQAEADAASAKAATAKEAAEYATMTPKEAATAKNEAYIAVLDTKVNPENPRNGFFELDWNEQFVLQLKVAGYFGETDEEIVDRWFQDLCRNIGNETGVDMDRRGAGYINVNNLGNGKSEIS